MLLALAAIVLFAAPTARAEESFEWNRYFAGRTVSIDGEVGLALLTDSKYQPVDYYPGYGFTVEYHLPALVVIGFEFQQNETNGAITLPTTNLGNLDAKGRLTLTAYSLQFKFSTPVMDDIFNAYLEAGLGAYVVNLDVSADLVFQGYPYSVDLKYTIVENGINGGLGFDLVFLERLKVGVVGRIHYILEKEKETDFGAANVFFKLGYTM
jgi:hypothetical protein